MSQYDASNDRLGILHGMTMGENSKTASDLPPRNHRKSTSRSSKHRERRSSPATSTENPGESAEGGSGDGPRKTKFRFKKKHRHRDGDADERRSSKRHKQSHGSYHQPLQDDPTQYDDTYIPNAASWKYAEDQEAAFRESLFDAMADDEGAAFWESVYGQPMHVYERPTKEDPKGLLESMTDEEYAQYVREKMWEKSHQHIIEERERRAKAKEQDRKRAEEEQAAWAEEERRQRRRETESRQQQAVDKARQRWKKYLALWKEQMEAGDADRIPWPVISGRRADVSREAVEEFVKGAPLPDEKDETVEMVEMLKAERVRWHPDKAQQRWGKDGGLDEPRMRAITVCFQTIDRLHSEYKSR